MAAGRNPDPELNHEFNLEWLRRCQRVLKPNGSIWVTGTLHAIFSVGYAMHQLGFKILNDIAWEKPNPPPNLSCRYFTHSTETVAQRRLVASVPPDNVTVRGQETPVPRQEARIRRRNAEVCRQKARVW